MHGSLNVPVVLSRLLTLNIALCVQFDRESPAPEERLQEEHRESVPVRLHAAEPAP